MIPIVKFSREQRKKVRRRIRQLTREGLKPMAIAEVLNKEGFPVANPANHPEWTGRSVSNQLIHMRKRKSKRRKATKAAALLELILQDKTIQLNRRLQAVRILVGGA